MESAPAGRPVPLRTAVVRATSLTARMRRLVLGGGDLGHFVWSGPASHCKLILPAPGLDVGALPPAGALQPVRLDRQTQTLRTYTPRAWDPARGELTIDMLVHGDGPASHWASTAAPGTELAVTSPLGRYDVDARAAWLVLAGDETALPAIATILEVAPPHLPVTVLAEVAVPGDRLDLGAGAEVDVQWLAQRDGPGMVLLEAIEAHLPSGDGRIWVACEAHAMLAIRRHLLDGRGLARRSVATRGYWTSGQSEGPPPRAGAVESRWLR